MSKSLSVGPRLVRGVVLLGLVILLVALWAWWQFLYSQPSKTFDRMLSNSLSSPSISKEITQNDSGQHLDQAVQVVTSPDPAVFSRNVLTQGEATTDSATAITTENIGSPTADFVRYTNISTTQKTLSGKSFDFSSVLNIWGKSDQNDQLSGGAQLFNQNVLGVVPFANLTASQRQQLISQIQADGVYKTDFNLAKRGYHGMRPTYSYDVLLQPKAYVSMLKVFAHDLGLNQLDQVDPNQYENSQPLSFTFEVDIWSGQLISVAYKDSDRTEGYTAAGARLRIAQPTDTIGVDELQNRLQSLQQ